MPEPSNANFERRELVTDQALKTCIYLKLCVERLEATVAEELYKHPRNEGIVRYEDKLYRVTRNGESITVEEIIQFIG